LDVAVVGERCSFSPVVFGEVLRAAWCVPMSDVVKKGLLGRCMLAL
jgi:hypothetical protein